METLSPSSITLCAKERNSSMLNSFLIRSTVDTVVLPSVPMASSPPSDATSSAKEESRVRLGPLILRFSLGPRHTSTLPTDLLHAVIRDGAWNWPLITNIESVEIIHSLPVIFEGEDRIVWAPSRGTFTSTSAYDIFCPPGPKVGWSSLLLGKFKIPRHRFIIWLAILGKLSMLDKPWLHHLGSDYVLCSAATPESHEHLFFRCQFTMACICEIWRMI
ncbi:UNVERIFIED_CONTAM: hypothetical protein Slati_3460000 [Sesamum latifolium]|uniref:Reverse transcriptase zinc-binding domain-containing protein n=1 Tax=Sesamum latifolium TaxID=2727402 RepID=A0AAW2UJY6_9LAMI